jgi:4-aminobutyrate aminotransferase-like enzyme
MTMIAEMQIPGAMANGYKPGSTAGLDDRTRGLIERRDRALGPAYRLFYPNPVHIVRGEGVWLYDADGNRFLDLYNNVASLGHCHPAVLEAISRQAAILTTHTRYLHETVLDCAERLLSTMPENLAHMMFTCTGSEANDLALRIAQDHTSASGVIVTANAYHGVTRVVAEVSPSLCAHVKQPPHVRVVPAPRSGPDVGGVFAAGVRAAIGDLDASGHRVAALLCDTIFSSDGVVADPPGFLRQAVDEVRRAGGLFIADEVQPGFARTGAAMWGFLRHGVSPDIVTMGKPMGNGYPVAGLAVAPQVVEGFGRNARYFNTFGGNPVAAAAVLSVLDVIEREGLLRNSAVMGKRLLDGIRSLAGHHDCLGEIRGVGLFVGADIVRDGAPDGAAAAEIVGELRNRHILISATGPHGNILKVRPPLVIGAKQIDHFLSVLDSILDRRTR